MLLVFFLGSCGENREAEEMETEVEMEQEVQDPEEAMTNWKDAWNSQDPQQIEEQAASDAVLVLNGAEVPTDSLPGFYEGAGTSMEDLELRSLKKGSTDHMAYDTGIYTHTYVNDTTRHEGSYTFIWERADDENEWKVTAMNISDVSIDEEE